LHFGDRQTDRQTNRQTNRWTRPSREAAVAVASGGLIKLRRNPTDELTEYNQNEKQITTNYYTI